MLLLHALTYIEWNGNYIWNEKYIWELCKPDLICKVESYLFAEKIDFQYQNNNQNNHSIFCVWKESECFKVNWRLLCANNLFQIN